MKIRSRKIKKLSGGLAVFAGSQIIASFGNPAFAECAASSDSMCINTIDFCIPEQTLVEVTSANYATFPVEITAQQDNPNYPTYGYVQEPNSNFVLNMLHDSFPETDYYNNFDPGDTGLDPTLSSGPPNEGILVNREFDIIYNGDVAANTGPISIGNGRLAAAFTVYAEGYTWNAGLTRYENRKTHEQDFTIYVDHINEAPEASNMTTAVLNDDRDVESGITITDLESNNIDLTYQLSTDSTFSTVVDSADYNINLSPSGTEHTHIWQDVAEGTYYWRALIEETDSLGACTGYAETEIDPEFFSIASSAVSFSATAAPDDNPTLAPTGIDFISIAVIAVTLIFTSAIALTKNILKSKAT